MVIDREEHREIMLEIIKNVNVPGQHVELVAEVIKALREATVPITEPSGS